MSEASVTWSSVCKVARVTLSPESDVLGADDTHRELAWRSAWTPMELRGTGGRVST